MTWLIKKSFTWLFNKFYLSNFTWLIKSFAWLIKKVLLGLLFNPAYKKFYSLFKSFGIPILALRLAFVYISCTADHNFRVTCVCIRTVKALLIQVFLIAEAICTTRNMSSSRKRSKHSGKSNDHDVEFFKGNVL